MLDALKTYKPLIVTQLKRAQSDTHFSHPQLSLLPQALNRVVEYTTRGKMIRGALIMAFYEAGVTNPETEVKNSAAHEARGTIAAAMELLQSMLLIHDDIMDRDEQRRGGPSIHVQYRREDDARDLDQLGLSQGICAGDIAGFMAMDLIASTAIILGEAKVNRLLSLFSREMWLVGAAQMQDVHWSHRLSDPGPETILDTFRFKTGRYTFSLPLMAAGILLDMDGQHIEKLSQLGEELGVIFQLRDDWIGLFQSEARSGKPQGSDVLAQKKTLYRQWFFDTASSAGLNAWERAASGEQGAMDGLIELLKGSGVEDRGEQLLRETSQRCLALIEDPGFSPGHQKFLRSLVDFNVDRKS